MNGFYSQTYTRKRQNNGSITKAGTCCYLNVTARAGRVPSEESSRN
jgi:hypothetical protein